MSKFYVARVFVIIAAALMFVAVGAGAFGAHGLAGYFEQYARLERIKDRAVRYHMIHALALLVAAWARTHTSSTMMN